MCTMERYETCESDFHISKHNLQSKITIEAELHFSFWGISFFDV